MTQQWVTLKEFMPNNPLELGKIDKFYSFKMGRNESGDWFLHRYQRMWASVRGLGVSELDGVLQLVYALTPEWRPWAAKVALNFVHPDMEARVTGNLMKFIELIREQYRTDSHPPLGSYPSLDQFIPTVHQILSNALAPKESDLDNELSESDEDFLVFPEFEIPRNLTSIDLDLYGQPFALRTPSPVTPSQDPQLETSSVVGTSTLQPLPVDHITFNNEPNDLTTGVSDRPSTSHSQPYREESDPETPEGYHDPNVTFED